MGKKFGWEHIKDGCNGFENFAYDYVNCEFSYKDKKWKQTPKTRDGNKDAFIIVGYKPIELSQEEWWMEAKYSLQKDILTRYRLDSTIVSAIRHGNVSKIIFVTNIEITSKTALDLQRVLYESMNCREVHFCTKNQLEFWLSQHEDVFRTYFGDDVEMVEFGHDIVLENVEIYSSKETKQIFS